MPDKRQVNVAFRSRQDGEGDWAEEALAGEWFKLQTGYVLRCGEEMTVSFLKGDVRVVRQGEVGLTQSFRLDAALPGAVHTPQGSLQVEAFTHEVAAELTDAGGRLAWRYDMRVDDQSMGQFEIVLDIREELGK